MTHDKDGRTHDGGGPAGWKRQVWCTYLTPISNLPQALDRLVAVLDALGKLENLQVSSGTLNTIIAQSGAVDPAAVRLQAKENRKLSPTELVEPYEARASQAELARRFGLHEQTIRAYLRRQGMRLRALMEAQEAEAVRLYVEET